LPKCSINATVYGETQIVMTKYFPDMPALTARTSGGHLAVVSSIDPLEEDCLGGYIINPKAEPPIFEVEWDLNGSCRNHSSSANIDLIKAIENDSRFGELIEIIKRTRAEKI
jgi:hypothetical protein